MEPLLAVVEETDGRTVVDVESNGVIARLSVLTWVSGPRTWVQLVPEDRPAGASRGAKQ